MGGWGWPLNGFKEPFATGWIQVAWWAAECAAEFSIGALVVCYGNVAYWVFDRFLLGPLLLRPIDAVLGLTTRAYAVLLRTSLAAWPVVLLVSVGLILAAAGMLYYDVLGRELTPSEDQSRFIAHIVLPVGSSIDQVDRLLRDCETILAAREDVEGMLTTVAGEQGQLMNEADIFVHLVAQDQRPLRQKDVMQAVRFELEKLPDVRVVMRDLSTEGFTAQRGDPVDFAVIGDWKRLPLMAHKVLEEMRRSGAVQDVDSDYRPGMPEVRIIPDREKLAAIGVPVGRLADSLSLYVGGQRVGKFTDQGSRYDVRVRLRLQQRATPEDLDVLTLRAADNRLVPVSDVSSRVIVSTLPVINRYNHQRKVEITAAPAQGVSPG